MKPDVLLIEDTLAEMPIEEVLAPHFTVHLLPEGGDRDAVVTPVAARIRAVSTSTLVGADAALIGALPRLEIIACAGTHVDRIDVDAARARDIKIANTPHLSTDDVADLVMGLAVALARRIPAADAFVRAGRWSEGLMPLASKVSGRRLGILGLGHIGREVARRAEGYKMEISYHDRGPEPGVPWRYVADLVEMARGVDFLAVTCSSSAATRRIVNRNVLEALGPNGFVINIARGVIDEEALITALEAGAIAGAASDVFESEPRLPAALLGMENVILTPHIGSATRETRRGMAETLAANLKAHFAGQPLPNPVA